ncbi:MAG: L-threonylcarbamoyladenylate synthase [Sphingomonadales bacterium]
MQTAVGTDLQLALNLLERGQLVSIPTETVYGLAADANNEDAVLSIFKAKDRPKSNPLILHFATLEQALPYTLEFPEVFEQLYAAFCPGPITFVVPKSSLVSALITGGQSTVALRFPAHPLLQQLLELLEYPLAAPSANLYGQLSPTTAQHVLGQLNERIPYILDGGPCLHGLESTIIGLDNDQVVIYRHGGITAEMLAEQLGYTPQIKTQKESGVLTSGMVKHHYATQTPLFLGFKSGEQEKSTLQITLGPNEQISGPHLILSQEGLLLEAARHLYAALHEADAMQVDQIYVEPFPNVGLGKAMNDRLSRAAAKFSE